MEKHEEPSSESEHQQSCGWVQCVIDAIKKYVVGLHARGAERQEAVDDYSREDALSQEQSDEDTDDIRPAHAYAPALERDHRDREQRIGNRTRKTRSGTHADMRAPECPIIGGIEDSAPQRAFACTGPLTPPDLERVTMDDHASLRATQLT